MFNIFRVSPIVGNLQRIVFATASLLMACVPQNYSYARSMAFVCDTFPDPEPYRAKALESELVRGLEGWILKNTEVACYNHVVGNPRVVLTYAFPQQYSSGFYVYDDIKVIFNFSDDGLMFGEQSLTTRYHNFRKMVEVFESDKRVRDFASITGVRKVTSEYSNSLDSQQPHYLVLKRQALHSGWRDDIIRFSMNTSTLTSLHWSSDDITARICDFIPLGAQKERINEFVRNTHGEVANRIEYEPKGFDIHIDIRDFSCNIDTGQCYYLLDNNMTWNAFPEVAIAQVAIKKALVGNYDGCTAMKNGLTSSRYIVGNRFEMRVNFTCPNRSGIGDVSVTVYPDGSYSEPMIIDANISAPIR